MPTRCPLVLSAFAIAIACLQPGCSPPQETLPTFPSSAGTTEEAIPESSGSTGPAGEAEEEGETPEVSVRLIDYEGLQQQVKSFAGKVVIVDIWSTSCLPCMREFPNLVELSHKFPDRVECISMNVDYIGIKSKPPESYLPKVEEFLVKQRATIHNFATSEPDSDILEKFGAESLPAIILFAPDGELAHRLTDANTGEDGLTYQGDVIPKVEQLLPK